MDIVVESDQVVKPYYEDDITEWIRMSPYLTMWDDTNHISKTQTCLKHFSDSEMDQILESYNINGENLELPLKKDLARYSIPKWAQAPQMETFPFEITPGKIMHLNADELQNPMQIFRKLLTQELLTMLAENTNAYATQKGNWSKEQYVQENDIWIFIGLIIWMSDLKLSSLRDYWSSDPFLVLGSFDKVFTCERFMDIMRNLQLTLPSQNLDTVDKLYKIRPMMNTLSASYRRHWQPSNEMTVGQHVCYFRGKSILEQYLPSTLHRWAFRVWKLCDSSGYLLNFDVYQGKEAIRNSAADPSIGEQVALNLVDCEMAVNKPIRLFANKFFTSIRLIEVLKAKGFLLTGKIRKGMIEVPKFKLEDSRRLKKSEYSHWINKEGVLLTSWIKSKQALMATTAYGTSDTLTSNGSPEQKVECPESIS